MRQHGRNVERNLTNACVTFLALLILSNSLDLCGCRSSLSHGYRLSAIQMKESESYFSVEDHDENQRNCTDTPCSSKYIQCAFSGCVKAGSYADLLEVSQLSYKASAQIMQNHVLQVPCTLVSI
jgi:hypothetical protein